VSTFETGSAPKGGFVATDDIWRFEGSLTMDNAAAVLAAAGALPLPPSGRLDLGGLEHADSSALAVIMALRRRARAENRVLAIDNLPLGLQSLAHVYGVEELARGTA
jgi:phospholipid transport system transporter-binding protein